mgnify:CR=1 FL=1
MADRIIAKVFTPRNIQARSVAPSQGVQASSVWLGSGLNLADLSDVVIPPANAVTGALMKDIDSPNLKLIGGAF